MGEAERLIEEHYADIYRLALRLLGDSDAAADLTQEVFSRALRSLPRFRHESSPRTWLYRIALNEARRPRKRALPLDDAAMARRADPAAGPEPVAMAHEDSARLHRLIRRLPDRYREAVVLHYLQGLEQRDVAALLSTNENTVKTWLHRARAQLRLMWGER